MSTLTAPHPTESPTPTAPSPKKPFIRRHLLDHSQRIRHTVQIAFLALNAWLGLEFFLWVRYYETNGHSFYLDRPAGVEGWLPIAGLMNLKYFLSTHHVSSIHPAAMVLLVIFLISSWLLKKSFCSWLCPVGTVSEYLWHLGQQLFHRSLILPRWLDIPLRSLKYILLAFFVYVVATLDADGLQQFLLAPFGIIADVKMLNFFRHMSVIGIAVIVTLVLLSLMIQNVWCRFLCPYGALMGLVSTLSPVKIRRDQAACIDCNKCNQACPSHLPVAQLITIRSAECTGCLSCIAICPAENALNFAFPPRSNATYAAHTFRSNPETSPAAQSLALSNARWRNRALQPRTVVLILAIIFFGLITFARATHHWQTNLPRSVYQQLVPHADDYTH
jgi:polyferredoxin